MIPDDLQYTAEHEWVRDPGETDGSLRIGITDYAQEQLGDIVYVQLPDVGSDVSSGDPMGELESTKSVNDLFAPVSGSVVAKNSLVDANPELVNTDPYGDGWLIEIDPSNREELDSLLSAADYEGTITSN
jgi:glycine cleavage system H protein